MKSTLKATCPTLVMGLPALQILTQLSILVAGRLWLLTQPYLFTLLPLFKIVAHFKICCYFNLQQNSCGQWIKYLDIKIKIESNCRHKSWNYFGSLEVFLFALFLTSVFVFGICWPWALIRLCHLLWPPFGFTCVCCTFSHFRISSDYDSLLMF